MNWTKGYHTADYSRFTLILKALIYFLIL